MHFNIIELPENAGELFTVRGHLLPFRNAINNSGLQPKIKTYTKYALLDELNGAKVYSHKLPDDLRKYTRQATCTERAGIAWDRTKEVLDLYMNDSNVYENGDEDLPPFYEYGLCFDYVALGTFGDQEQDYYRYQFSYGGPSDELRIYNDGTVEYWFLDWFDGAHIDVSTENCIQWVVDMFEGIGSIDWELHRYSTDHYNMSYYHELNAMEHEGETACYYCGSWVDDDDVFVYDGDDYCENCYNDYAV